MSLSAASFGPSQSRPADSNKDRTTRFVLEKWGNDEPVFHNFFAGIHNLQMYVGSLAEGKRRDAEVAAKFLNHALPSIRKWAQLELASAASLKY